MSGLMRDVRYFIQIWQMVWHGEYTEFRVWSNIREKIPIKIYWRFELYKNGLGSLL